VDAAAFAALLPGDAAASLDVEPLGPVRHLGVRDDGRELCLVEPSARRVWRLSVDAATGTPSTAAPVDLAALGATSPAACAYDEAGGIAVLDARGHVARPGKTPLALGRPLRDGELLRVDGVWIVAEAGGPTALCVGDDGVVRDTRAAIDAMAPAPEGLVYLAHDDDIFAARAASLCAGDGPAERVAHDEGYAGAGVFEWLYATPPLELAYQRLELDNPALGWRADGSLLLAAENVRRVLADDDGAPFRVDDWAGEPLLRVLPQYAPIDVDARVAAFDRFRAPGIGVHVFARRPNAVSAIVSIPGGPDLTDDWAHFGEPAPAPVDPETDGEAPVADAGPSPGDAGADAGVEPPPSGSGGGDGGCGAAGARSAPATLALAAFVALGWRRRRGGGRHEAGGVR
jgi:uncharacterized protein (TIGR03382 family)